MPHVEMGGFWLFVATEVQDLHVIICNNVYEMKALVQ